jgi:hypothetical protein
MNTCTSKQKLTAMQVRVHKPATVQVLKGRQHLHEHGLQKARIRADGMVGLRDALAQQVALCKSKGERYGDTQATARSPQCDRTPATEAIHQTPRRET